MFSRPAFLLLSVLALVSGLMGGCSQRMAVEGTREQLVAEAKGALLSEGFHPVGRGGAVAGTEGSNPRAGRLEFLYYCDTMSPTVVEIQISPNTAPASHPVHGGISETPCHSSTMSAASAWK